MAAPPGDEAHLALTNVRVARQPCSIYVYANRVEVEAPAGVRVIPMSSLTRVATRKSWRGSRLLITLESGEMIDVRKLSASATSVAHRTIIDIARGHH